MVDLKEIESWEHHYLEQMTFMLLKDKDKMINALNSKDEIKIDLIEAFNKKSCDIDRGAERIYYWLFNNLGTPNSTPIGSDLLYETHNAFIHVDVKTSRLNKNSDKKRKLQLSKNQVGYNSNKRAFEVSLPIIHDLESKHCFTYLVNIVYEKNQDKLVILGIFIISLPNNSLNKVYKKEIVQFFKGNKKDVHFQFSRKPNFELLPNKPSRVNILFISHNYQGKEFVLLSNSTLEIKPKELPFISQDFDIQHLSNVLQTITYKLNYSHF